MSHENIIRAWKDEEFRNNLSASDRALLPEHPAGLVEVSGNDLKVVGGGARRDTFVTFNDDSCRNHPCRAQ